MHGHRWLTIRASDKDIECDGLADRRLEAVAKVDKRGGGAARNMAWGTKIVKVSGIVRAERLAAGARSARRADR